MIPCKRQVLIISLALEQVWLLHNGPRATVANHIFPVILEVVVASQWTWHSYPAVDSCTILDTLLIHHVRVILWFSCMNYWRKIILFTFKIPCMYSPNSNLLSRLVIVVLIYFDCCFVCALTGKIAALMIYDSNVYWHLSIYIYI